MKQYEYSMILIKAYHSDKDNNRTDVNSVQVESRLSVLPVVKCKNCVKYSE